MIPWVCVTILAIACPLLWWLRGRRLQRLFAGVLEQQSLAHAAALDALERALKVATEEYAAVRLEVEAARELTQAERDKSSRYFLKITDFENERNQWQKLYSDQSIGHGNAQNLMMRTIEQFARKLQDKGVRVQVPKVLQTVREEFLTTHEMPARALAEAMHQAQVSGQAVARAELPASETA